MATRKTAKVPQDYEKIKKHLLGDKRHCSVIAIAAITKLPPKQVQEALAAAGRKVGCGTPIWASARALKLLGFKVTIHRDLWLQAMIQSYPGRAKLLKNITTHHPRRYKKAWANQPDMLLFTNSHVAAYVNGKVVDWSIKKSLQITEVWTIEKFS